MSSLFVVDSTLGAMYLGMVFATSLHGISILQAWYYYTEQSDKWPLKSLVAAVMVCNTVHEALITHAVYVYTITHWGNAKELFALVRSLVLSLLFSGLTTLLVQSFLTVRLWRLSRNPFIFAFTVLIVLAQFGASAALSLLSLQRKTIVDTLDLRPLSLAIIVIAAVGDVIIAGALCFVLHRSRTGFRRYHDQQTRVIMFAVNTGLLTSIYAVASLIAYLTAPDTFINIAFSFSIGRLYTNALLATLNARKRIGDMTDNIHDIDTNMNDKVTLSLRHLSSSGATSRQRGAPNISIKINTTKECITDIRHDQEQDHDEDKTGRLRPSSSSLTADFEGKAM